MSTGPTTRSLSAAQARRAVLGALGLTVPRPTGRIDVRHFRRVYDAIRIIQIDPINVLARAHHQVAMTRLGPYDTDAFDDYVWRSGEVYESWVHVDATTQVDAWPLLAHRRASTMPWRAVQDVMEHRPDFLDSVLAEIDERGELTAAQLRDPGERLGSWGTRSMGRAALDYLHHRGDLTISFRDDRMTVYFDLTERVLPAEILAAPVPDEEAAQRGLLARGLQAMALGTAADIADWHRQHLPTARRLLADMADDGLIDVVEVEGWTDPVYADPGLTIPRRTAAPTLVNPFDPLMWNRDRALRLFGLDYRIEIYVPADQRRYGYYALPFLVEDRIAALVDLKHDRKAGTLDARQVTWLDRAEPADRDHLDVELAAWATWVGAGAVTMPTG